MADNKSSPPPIKSVQIDALVEMRIIKHPTQSFPTVATGQLLGMDVEGTLEVTNCFPFPGQPEVTAAERDDPSITAAATPRLKSAQWYQGEMVKLLREVNVDANSVGWYQSANLGNFINATFVENQYHYQSQMNERTVALVYDAGRSSQGGTALRAFRLTPAFMVAFKEGKFTSESLTKSNLTYKDILQELPLTVRNSHLTTTLLHQLNVPQQQQSLSTVPSSLSLLNNPPTSPNPSYPIFPNFNAFDLTIDPLLEKSCELLLDSIEVHNTEANNASFYQRQLAREQSKIAQWQQKRKAENQARVAAKQPPLPEDEYLRIFKLPQEPNKLETMLNSRQVEQYARQVDGFTATTSAKLFAINGGLPKFQGGSSSSPSS